jgi:hypothetical protein
MDFAAHSHPEIKVIDQQPTVRLVEVDTKFQDPIVFKLDDFGGRGPTPDATQYTSSGHVLSYHRDDSLLKSPFAHPWLK